MVKNTGKPYEKLTQDVFASILKQDGATTVVVEHDRSIQGKTALHQIDVYWKFRYGPAEYETLVQCKDWASPVNQGEVLKFKAVLDDIPGQPRGIMVTRTGFQSGARDCAEAHGIILYELREPTATDWDGYVCGVKIDGRLNAAKTRDVRFLVYDFEGLQRELGRLGMQMPSLTVATHETILEREDGSPLSTLDGVIQGLVPKQVDTEAWYEHAFSEPAYMATGVPALPRIRLRGLGVRFEIVEVWRQTLEVRLDKLVQHILQDVSTGERVLLNADARPLGDGEPRPGKILDVDPDAERPD